MFVEAINSHMQKRQILKVSNNIKYLENQINKTSIAEMREVFFKIIEEQMKSKMLAEASPEHTFMVVSPSMIPEKKSGPNRASICIKWSVFGGILSVLMVLAQSYLRKKF
jgi:LPS O-antigen subunit length determinant protein (WzzB/FepE family)